MWLVQPSIQVINRKTLAVTSSFLLENFISDFYNQVKLMHIGHRWLRCNCKANGVIMYPRLLGNTYSLVNHPQKGTHDLRCQFYTYASKVNFEKNILQRKPQSFMPTPLLGNNAATANGKSSLKGKRYEQTRIHQFLVHALMESGLNKSSFEKEHKLTSLYFSKVFSIKVGQGNHKVNLQVKDVTLVSPKNVQAIRSHEASMVKKSLLFSKNIPVHANFVLAVDSFEFYDNNCRFKLNSDSFCITADRVCHVYPNTNGPRLIFISKIYRDNEWSCHIVYSHPIFSVVQPMYVDSNIERIFINEMFNSKETGLVVEKFLLPVSYFGDFLLPDFKVTLFFDKVKSKSLISEVMGMINDDEYVKRKERLIPLFRKRFKMPVVEVGKGNMKEQCNTMLLHLKE